MSPQEGAKKTLMNKELHKMSPCPRLKISLIWKTSPGSNRKFENDTAKRSCIGLIFWFSAGI